MVRLLTEGRVAVPLVSDAVPRIVPLDVKATVPVAVPAVPDTLAVKLTDPPATDGELELVTVTVGTGKLTVCWNVEFVVEE